MASSKGARKPSTKRSSQTKTSRAEKKAAAKPATSVTPKAKAASKAKKKVASKANKQPLKGARPPSRPTRHCSTPQAPSLIALDMNAEEAFTHFLPEALHIEERDVIAFRADAQLALVNVRRGIEAAQRAADAAAEPLSQQALLRNLPYLALAVTFAAARALPQDESARAVTNTLLARTWQLRRILLKAIDACAEAGLIPVSEVDAIRKGIGAIDAAQDCVALTSLYHRHEASLRGKTPVTHELLAEAATTGSQLLMLLKPSSARPDPRMLARAAKERDRLWTLLVRQHEQLWKLGAHLFGKAVDEHIPPLQARQAHPKKIEPAVAEQPSEPVTA